MKTLEQDTPKPKKTEKETKPLICHVCGREKKPYTVFMNSSIFSLMQHEAAREGGEICQRCDQYHAMTGELKDATETEFKNAEKARDFANLMLAWWEKDKKLNHDLETYNEKEDMRQWDGTAIIAQWCRDHLNKKTGENDMDGARLKEVTEILDDLK